MLNITNHQGDAIKITVKYHSHLLEWILTCYNGSCQGCKEKGTPAPLLVEIVQSFLKKVKIELECGPTIPLLGIKQDIEKLSILPRLL